MRRVAVKIAYLGKHFFGSQVQPGRRTVGSDVLSDLSSVHGREGEWFDLRLASRTDRGVNALGNAAVFNTEFDDSADLMRALNAVSRGVFYRSYADVDPGFNPRHAKERVYRYVLRSDGLDPDAVKECASVFSGEHDFSGFSRTEGRNAVIDLDVTVSLEEDIVLVFRASHFLWNMIRRIAAAVEKVGRGEAAADEVAAVLDGKGGRSFGLARPDALTLCDVVYDIPFEPAPAFSRRIDEELFSLRLETGFHRNLKQ